MRKILLAVFSLQFLKHTSYFIRLNSCIFWFFMVECAQVIRKANFKMSKQLIYSGKAKDIYTTEDENLIISTYKDQATAFNGVKKEQIAGKGVLNNQISSFIFEKLNAAGVVTHFVEKLSDTEQLNKKVKIIPFGSRASATTRLVLFQTFWCG